MTRKSPGVGTCSPARNRREQEDSRDDLDKRAGWTKHSEQHGGAKPLQDPGSCSNLEEIMRQKTVTELRRVSQGSKPERASGTCTDLKASNIKAVARESTLAVLKRVAKSGSAKPGKSATERSPSAKSINLGSSSAAERSPVAKSSNPGSSSAAWRPPVAESSNLGSSSAVWKSPERLVRHSIVSQLRRSTTSHIASSGNTAVNGGVGLRRPEDRPPVQVAGVRGVAEREGLESRSSVKCDTASFVAGGSPARLNQEQIKTQGVVAANQKQLPTQGKVGAMQMVAVSEEGKAGLSGGPLVRQTSLARFIKERGTFAPALPHAASNCCTPHGSSAGLEPVAEARKPDPATRRPGSAQSQVARVGNAVRCLETRPSIEQLVRQNTMSELRRLSRSAERLPPVPAEGVSPGPTEGVRPVPRAARNWSLGTSHGPVSLMPVTGAGSLNSAHPLAFVRVRQAVQRASERVLQQVLESRGGGVVAGQQVLESRGGGLELEKAVVSKGVQVLGPYGEILNPEDWSKRCQIGHEGADAPSCSALRCESTMKARRDLPVAHALRGSSLQWDPSENAPRNVREGGGGEPAECVGGRLGIVMCGGLSPSMPHEGVRNDGEQIDRISGVVPHEGVRIDGDREGRLTGGGGAENVTHRTCSFAPSHMDLERALTFHRRNRVVGVLQRGNSADLRGDPVGLGGVGCPGAPGGSVAFGGGGCLRAPGDPIALGGGGCPGMRTLFRTVASAPPAGEGGGLGSSLLYCQHINLAAHALYVCAQ
jgi:hypothetical protein